MACARQSLALVTKSRCVRQTRAACVGRRFRALQDRHSSTNCDPEYKPDCSRDQRLRVTLMQPQRAAFVLADVIPLPSERLILDAAHVHCRPAVWLCPRACTLEHPSGCGGLTRRSVSWSRQIGGHRNRAPIRGIPRLTGAHSWPPDELERAAAASPSGRQRDKLHDAAACCSPALEAWPPRRLDTGRYQARIDAQLFISAGPKRKQPTRARSPDQASRPVGGLDSSASRRAPIRRTRVAGLDTGLVNLIIPSTCARSQSG